LGIARGAVSLLFELKSKHVLSGSVCQLGKQTIHVSKEQLSAAARKLGFGNIASNVPGKSVDDQALFHALGYDTVESLDYSNFENATHILDFNNPIPDRFHGKYDLVFDGGTMEHIFNLPESLRNIHKMLKPGGLVIHASPSSNHVDHGFYMFSPTLFYDWYTISKFDIVTSYIVEYGMGNPNSRWVVYEYTPGCIDSFSFGGLGSKRLGIWFVARKLEKSICSAVPQQGSYLRVWRSAKGETPALNRVQQLKQKIKERKFLYSLVLVFYVPFRRFFRWMPRVVARY